MEESTTSGRITIVCAPETHGLILRERSAFIQLYPRANIEVRVGSSREAVADLFADRCELAVIARELDEDERRAEMQHRLPLEGYRFARDAVVMIVNERNPIENLAIDDLRVIYDGSATNWTPLGGGDLEVVPVIQTPESDITQFFAHQVMGGERIRAHVVYTASDSEVVAVVRRDPRAIGYVSLQAAAEAPRVLRLATLSGLPYWKPDLETVYKGDYPLTRYLNIYVREKGPRLANGFITHLTSLEGQRMVRDAGLVPTSVPVRFVRRSPMLGTH